MAKILLVENLNKQNKPAWFLFLFYDSLPYISLNKDLCFDI